MTTREAFEAWVISHGGSADWNGGEYRSAPTECSWIAWQAATAAALERAAEEVSRVDNETWFQNQSAFGIACRAAIRALKDETE